MNPDKYRFEKLYIEDGPKENEECPKEKRPVATKIAEDMEE